MISVIIPAHNAQATLAETLDSLLAQTLQDWEAVVVDDGSTDGTAAVVARYAQQDARIRSASGPHQGVSAARNAGIRLARHPWLLFLDADDWVSPLHLERLTAELRADLGLDIVYCKGAFVAMDGTVFEEPYQITWGDPFQKFARGCVLPIHACLVRRTLVESLGGFDPSLRTCEDWDLWQRIARTGIRFGQVPEVLAFYRMRPNSASTNPRRMLEDGLQVIARGHARDERVRFPAPAHANGVPDNGLPETRYFLAIYTAGLALARGEDPLPLLDLLNNVPKPPLDPEGVARTLFNSMLIPIAQPPTAWPRIYPEFARRIDSFLTDLETRSSSPELARCVSARLKRLILDHATGPWPLTIGSVHATRIEVTEPIPDAALPVGIDRLLCFVELEGARIGALELPVCDGLVPREVLADAIAAKFAWEILGRFFARTLYPSLTIKPEAGGGAVWRGEVRLGSAGGPDGPAAFAELHDRIGWTALLQEVWGHADWPEARFYAPDPAPDAGEPRRAVDGDLCLIEVSDPLPSLEVAGGRARVIPAVGGSALGLVTVPASDRRVDSAQLRASITEQAGFELCRAVVREGVLGRPLNAEPATLRQRLALAAAARAARNGSGNAGGTAVPADQGMVLGRRLPELLDASVSRRARLPASASGDLLESALSARELIVRRAGGCGGVSAVRYAPELIDPGSPGEETVRRDRKRNHVGTATEAVQTGRLPILMYHRVAPEGLGVTQRYRVSPETFEEQLRYLSDHGFHSVGLDDWLGAMRTRKPLPGRAVCLTFDDGYRDFLTHAWPLLKRYGFTATVFLVAAEVGGWNRWDQTYGETVPLLTWGEIGGLRTEGVAFGSHTVTHRPLAGLSPESVVQEVVRSRARLERELQDPVRTIAYPYGMADEVVWHLTGACGYLCGVICEGRLARLVDNPLALPRIEIEGTDRMEDFIRKLSTGY